MKPLRDKKASSSAAAFFQITTNWNKNNAKKLGLYVLLLVAQNGAEAAVRNFTLHIDNGSLTITGTGGTTLSVWGYGEIAGLPTVPAPTLTANEGDTVNVTVYNHRSAQHNFVIKNVTSDATAIAANNGSKTYSFTAPAAGSYVYSDTLNNNINREMGLYGSFTDTRSNLMWTRCLLGATWNVTMCAGKASSYGWQHAQEWAKYSNYANFNDWRILPLKS